MKKKLIVLLMGVLCYCGMQAQMSLSLDEAVNYALENNKQLKANRYDIEKSEGAYKEARGKWLPQVDATLDYVTYFGYEMDFDMSSLYGSSSTSFTAEQYANAAVAGNNAAAAASALGGSGKFDVSQYAGGSAYESYLSSTLSPTTIDMGESSTAQLQATMVLFNGQLLAGIKAAKVGMELAQKSVELSELDVRYNVSNAYYSALTLQETLTTVDSSLSEMKDLVAKTEVMVRAGVMERTELDQLKVQLNNLKTTKLAMARNVDVTYNLLRFHLGLPVNEPLVLTDNLDQIMDDINVEKALNDEFDINSNLNYQIIGQQVELSKKMLNSEKYAYAPTLSAYYQHNKKFKTSGFDMNPENVGGLTLSVPIFSGFQRKNKVAQQKIEVLQAEANQEVLEDNLYLQETQLRSDYISKFEEYQNQKENVEVARRVFESYEHKFKQGVASGMDLTQANSTYLQAESSYLSSVLSVLQARVAFFKLLNDL